MQGVLTSLEIVFMNNNQESISRLATEIRRVGKLVPCFYCFMPLVSGFSLLVFCGFVGPPRDFPYSKGITESDTKHISQHLNRHLD